MLVGAWPNPAFLPFPFNLVKFVLGDQVLCAVRAGFTDVYGLFAPGTFLLSDWRGFQRLSTVGALAFRNRNTRHDSSPPVLKLPGQDNCISDSRLMHEHATIRLSPRQLCLMLYDTILDVNVAAIEQS